MPMPVRGRVLKTFSLALTAGNQTQGTEIIEPIEGIRALNIDLTVTAAGTLVTAAKVTAAISSITVTDRAGRPVLEATGADLPIIYQQLNGSGHYVTPDTATDATAKYFRCSLPLPIALKDQPCKLQVVFAPYSALAASGCTGATVVLDVRPDYGPVQGTIRVHKHTFTLASGAGNKFGTQLSDGIKTVNMFLAVGTESNITDITYSSDGAIDEYSKLPLEFFIDKEKAQYLSGHTTGSVNLFLVPHVYNTSTSKLSLTGAGSDTLTVYQVGLN